MSNEDASEDRLNKTEFAELIQHLSMQEVVTIEYRIGKNWRKLFTRQNIAANTFFCNLCAVETSSFKNLLAHIDGRRHKLQMDRIQQLYHPDYTHPKNDKKDSTEKSEISQLTNSNKNVGAPSINKVHITKTPTNVGSGTKNDSVLPVVSAEKNNKNCKSTIGNKSPTPEDKPIQKTTIKDSTNIENAKITGNKDKLNNHNILKTGATTTVEKEDEKNNNSNSNGEKLQLKSTFTTTVEKQCIQEETDSRSNQNAESLTSNNNKQNVDKESSPSLVKNPFAQDKKKSEGKGSGTPKPAVNIESSSKSTQNNTTTKEKDDKKRSSADGNTGANESTEGEGATESKKAKIVLNPAAALSDKASSSNNTDKGKSKSQDSDDKPQYQTDKIIIPTKHKSSKDTESPRATTTASSSSSSSQNKDVPKFSVKTYSSKPSDNDVHGMLGVEYVIKILKSRTDTSPRYECGLCELVLDGFAMQRHLEGYNHRLKFCEKHFPTAIRHYRQYMHNIPEHELFKVMTPVLTKLAMAIEHHHGRNLPYECYERDFSLNRHEILAKAFSCRHASEQYGPTFTHVVGAKEIDNYINDRHRYISPSTSRTAIFDSKVGNSSRSESRHISKDSITRDRHRHVGRGESTLQHGETPYKSYMSSTGYNDLYPPSNVYSQPVVSNPVARPVDDETYKLMVDDFLKGTLKGISGVRSRDHRKRSASPTSSSVKRKSLSPLRQNDIWQAYRHMVDQGLTNLEERFKQYRKDPETHPSYNEEWQKFWKRRKDELITAGLDHRKYNYQPEWVRFIKVRIEELYGQEVENLKVKSRERLCLPMSNNNLSEVKYHVQSSKMNSPDVVLISSSDATNTPPPADNNAMMAQNSSNNLAMTLQSSITCNPQVVSVLRLMTALEDDLGSLGPKIVDILSKALQAEKANPAQVNAVILNDKNCTIIETAKEKLKGLVMAGLFEGSKNRVLKKVVKDTEALLNHAQQFRHAVINSQFSSTSVTKKASGNQNLTSTAVSSLHIGNQLSQYDKNEIAAKLAASLTAQGKTDFDPQQLQQLLTVCKLFNKNNRSATSSSSKGNTVTATLANKKTLSDELSDLLKPTTSTSSKQSNTSTTATKTANESAYRMSSQSSSDSLSSNTNALYSNNNFGGVYPPNSAFPSVSQNSGGNYFSNAIQSIDNGIGVSREGLLHVGSGHVNYGAHYPNNTFNHSYQQNSNPINMYNNNPYPNNSTMPQNWNWNSSMGPPQNYNMGGSSDSNQTSNWRNF